MKGISTSTLMIIGILAQITWVITLAVTGESSGMLMFGVFCILLGSGTVVFKKC